MWRQLLILALCAPCLAASAAIDLNNASVADLDGIKGIGPAVSARILDERKKGSFKDWNDFIARIKGIGPANAARFSAEGLTINGARLETDAQATPARMADEKPAARNRKTSDAAAATARQ